MKNDKVYRKDFLEHAYHCCKANGGAAGVDGQKFEDIEAYGEQRWLDELAQELKDRTYRPLAVRRVYIPKADGKTQRPLGIPAIRDRAVQMAAVLVLEPIFEADLQPEQYGYRRDRSAFSECVTLDQGIGWCWRVLIQAAYQLGHARIATAGIQREKPPCSETASETGGKDGERLNRGDTKNPIVPLASSRMTQKLESPPKKNILSPFMKQRTYSTLRRESRAVVRRLQPAPGIGARGT